MAETDQILLDEFQLVELATIMSDKTEKICRIKHRDSWKLLLGLYRHQIVYPKEKEWLGIRAKALATLVKVKSNEHRHLKSLVDLDLVEVQTDYLSSSRDKKYTLSNGGRLFVEEILQKSENMIRLFSTEILTGDLPRVIGALDKYNILVGTLAYLHNFDPENANDFPNLYELSQTLDLKPNSIMDSIKNFCYFDGQSPEKNTPPFFEIYPEKPRFKRFAFNCNDLIICNWLCILCHRTEIRLTALGEEMCKALVKTPQTTNYRIRQVSIEKFFTFSMIISFGLMIFAWLFNNSIIDVFIYTLTMIALTNAITYGVLKSKNSQLLFEQDEMEA